MAATSTLARFVVVAPGDVEVGRYNHKQSANRASRKVEGATVVGATEWDARTDALVASFEETAAETVAAVEAREVAEAPAVEEAPEAPAVVEAPKAKRERQATAADARHADLKSQARKLTLPERRALALRIHEAVRGVLDDLEADADAGRLAGTDLADVSRADLEVTAGNWMWHVPQGGATWGQNR